jgi:hypothetical protein
MGRVWDSGLDIVNCPEQPHQHRTRPWTYQPLAGGGPFLDEQWSRGLGRAAAAFSGSVALLATSGPFGSEG